MIIAAVMPSKSHCTYRHTYNQPMSAKRRRERWVRDSQAKRTFQGIKLDPRASRFLCIHPSNDRHTNAVAIPPEKYHLTPCRDGA
jgi:hypothetical protein